jgi:hypothetical protein
MTMFVRGVENIVQTDSEQPLLLAPIIARFVDMYTVSSVSVSAHNASITFIFRVSATLFLFFTLGWFVNIVWCGRCITPLFREEKEGNKRECD